MSFFLFANEGKKIESRTGASAEELQGFTQEVATLSPSPSSKTQKHPVIKIVKVGVSHFDDLVNDHGLETGASILISGGCGTGKTTMAMQSLYYGATHGEKCIYVSFEEDPEKIKAHMLKNFGWDFYKLEKEGKFAFIKLDPIKVARVVEAAKMRQEGALRVEIQPVKLPFKPDRVCIDSLSALSIAFENEENYRRYIRSLFAIFESYNSLNFILSETEQDPSVYSRAGIEEFLADGVIVLYNLKVKTKRKNALEILKLRSSGHVKRLVPYKITTKGFVIDPHGKV